MLYWTALYRAVYVGKVYIVMITNKRLWDSSSLLSELKEIISDIVLQSKSRKLRYLSRNKTAHSMQCAFLFLGRYIYMFCCKDFLYQMRATKTAYRLGWCGLWRALCMVYRSLDSAKDIGLLENVDNLALRVFETSKRKSYRMTGCIIVRTKTII